MAGPFRHDLEVHMVPVGEIRPWADNPRDNDLAAERLAYTIGAHGWTVPILLDRTGQIVAGHTRYKAALKLGLEAVPTIRLDAEGDEAVAIAIADNRIGEMAEWERDGLAELLRRLDDGGADLFAVGYDGKELASALEKLSDVFGTDDALHLEEGLVYRLIVDCADESAQAALLEKLELEGYVCQPLIS